MLSGTDPALSVHNLVDLITGKPKQGGNVQLTINPRRRRPPTTALQAAGPAPAVALDPQTGAILALAHTPTYDPNQLRHTRRHQARQDRQPAATGTTPTSRCSTGRITETYPPGSTFKLVTAAAALSDRQASPRTPPCPRADRATSCPAHQRR